MEVEPKVPLLANQLLVQVDGSAASPDTAVLTFGHASAPPVTGDAAEQHRQLQDVEFVQCHALIRVAVGKSRLREFADVLAQAADNMETTEGSA
jgi:hypothetical protein